MSPTLPEPPLILEKALAEQLGVTRKMLTTAREKLAEGADWRREKNAIAYTEAGVKKIAALLALQIPLAGADAPASTDVRTVYVQRTARRNSRVIFVWEKKEGGPERPVRVRDAAMFVPGQEIQVRAAGGELHLHGRQPTRRGRL